MLLWGRCDEREQQVSLARVTQFSGLSVESHRSHQSYLLYLCSEHSTPARPARSSVMITITTQAGRWTSSISRWSTPGRGWRSMTTDPSTPSSTPPSRRNWGWWRPAPAIWVRRNLRSTSTQTTLTLTSSLSITTLMNQSIPSLTVKKWLGIMMLLILSNPAPCMTCSASRLADISAGLSPQTVTTSPTAWIKWSWTTITQV